MIKQTEETARDQAPEPVFGNYRLDPLPRRREGGSLLFLTTTSDGSPASLQVSADPVTSRRTRARFRRLARARAELRHPALLDVREVSEERGRVYIATEPFPGRSLADVLREGPLESNRALRLLKDVAAGLDAGHAAGLVHRTLSPESVLLDGDRVRLDLFGVFTVVGQPSWGDVVRKDAHLHYESPEGVRGEELVGASNVYSLTGMLVHAVTGQPPFAHRDPAMISYAHVTQPPPKPSERTPELPSGLDAIVARGMAKDPGDRQESAGALVAAAAMVLRTASKPSSEPPTRDSGSRSALPAKAAAAPYPAAPSPTAPAPPASGAPVPPAPVPAGAVPTAPTPRRPVPPTLPAGPPAPHKPPLRARLAPFGPVFLVFVLAAIFGALLGTPGSGSQQAAQPVRSADELAVARLDDVRFRLRDDLAFASSSDEQADVAGRLAMAYGRAADNVSSPELVSAAEAASLAYVGLQRAASGPDESAYESARARVERAEDRVERELARMTGNGRPE
jgi:serine/threonine protein kinase